MVPPPSSDHHSWASSSINVKLEQHDEYEAEAETEQQPSEPGKAKQSTRRQRLSCAE